MTDDLRTEVTAVRASGAPRELQLVWFVSGIAQSVPLPPRGEITVGRSRECEARVDEPSISRRHVTIRVADGLAIEDLFSANGVRLGGARISPGQQVSIGVGTIFHIGDVRAVIAANFAHTDPSPMTTLHTRVAAIARGEITVLITGETGAGKEVLAREIHDRSPRAHKSFVGFNCAALPEHLIESELFGYEKGAFTGAVASKPGLFESAAGGTVLLDEIGDMPMATQTKILRVLEAREVIPLGGVRPRRIDVRTIGATNRNLQALVDADAFRADLLFRLAGVTMHIPPLRERVDEIYTLATALLAEECRKMGQSPKTLSPAAKRLLESYGWPGNVRELRHAMERASLLAQREVVGVDDVDLASVSSSKSSTAADAESTDNPEAARILQALEQCAGNQTAAAKKLGISRKALVWKLDKLNVKRPRRP